MNVNLTKRKPAATTSEVVVEERPAKPGGKNVPTPRRNAARAQRAKTIKGTPASKKEARQKTRASYDANRELLKQTDVSKLPAAERIPELVYVRDLVDTRTNLATAIIPVAVLYFFATFAVSALTKNRVFQNSLLFLTFFWLLAMVADAVIMSRKVETAVQRRYPDSTLKVRMYAGRRAFALKRMRRPVVRGVADANSWKARP